MPNLLDYLIHDCEKTPDKPAISDKDNQYTYENLLLFSKKAAKLLSKANIHNKPIAVIAEHTADTIALFFGVLYSGNYYVPIDPEMPIQKMQSIFDDALFPAILGNVGNIINSLNFQGDFYTVSDIEKSDSVDLALPQITGEAPAYMIYTSGSTGTPKGVIKSHNAVIRFIESFTSTFVFSDNEVIGNQTPFFFDASAKDIYLMLKLGCKMEILPSTLFSLPPELIDYLNAKKITYACWVPSALSIVAQLNPFSMVVPRTLKKMFFVGEVMPVKHLKKWMEALPDIKYVNLYGASETAGVCCYYEVHPEDLARISIPIGKPFKHCDIYLVDDRKIVTESNHVGEIFIVSDSLATEYFHDAKKTENAFLHRDFGNGVQRCFKTGDLAQYDKDHNLIFAARADFQIKHMGHRIELGEIESICSKLDFIEQCCCLYNEEKKKIILVCKTTFGCTLGSQEIKRILKPYLSTYMIPEKVIISDQLPLNANGKIDRQKIKNIYGI